MVLTTRFLASPQLSKPKKTGLPALGNPVSSLRPVACRPRLPTGLALSDVQLLQRLCDFYFNLALPGLISFPKQPRYI